MTTTGLPLSGLHFLRPYLFQDLKISHKSAYIRFFNSTCKNYVRRAPSRPIRKPEYKDQQPIEFRGDVAGRIELLKKREALKWPRIKPSAKAITCKEFLEKYNHMQAGQTISDEFPVIRGKLKGFRIAGKKLSFLDIVQEGEQVQVVCNVSKLETFSGVGKAQYFAFQHSIQRGDIISVSGNPHVTKSGEISILATELPIILSPSLASLPRTLTDRETRVRARHVDMLVNKEVSDTLRLRSHIMQYMRQFFIQDKFVEVQTPLIADKATGAIAKAFSTTATEFPEKKLEFRIAPELWLKRLVIGGIDRVFEIGPAFRNEGLDATHNPEFTTCEFYKAYAELEELMSMTEKLFSGLGALVEELRQGPLNAIPALDPAIISTPPFNRIEFIPAIQEALGEDLPDLAAEDATEKVMELFNRNSIPLPASPTLPRLLDKLASIHIEPDCISPTFIINHPACMGPLAKSFRCAVTNQLVSARAELFIQNREIANMYEEENSPFEQRAKFVQQQKFKDHENNGEVDESYLEALEWALPPTGGWGAGVDRIIMMFSGAKRISEVLSFGSLRNVVNLSNTTEKKSHQVSVESNEPNREAEEEEAKDETKFEL